MHVAHYICVQLAALVWKGAVTCSALCDEAAWLEASFHKGLLHYLQSHPVLHTASRVKHLSLCQNLQKKHIVTGLEDRKATVAGATLL